MLTLASLALLTALAWLYLASGAGMGSTAEMAGMAGMPGMSHAPPWPLVAAMWAVMMVAMMLPSAAPAILLYGRVHRHSIRDRAPPTIAFLAGYLVCWTGFALLAAALQPLIAAPMSMALESRRAAAALLIATGLYQLSPLKDACLAHCRSPAGFFARHYRPGARGAARLGLLHGAYCLGCCWLLMTLLFVGGAMNLLWIAGLTLLVAAEKLLPGGAWIARLSGGALIAWGLVLLAT